MLPGTFLNFISSFCEMNNELRNWEQKNTDWLLKFTFAPIKENKCEVEAITCKPQVRLYIVQPCSVLIYWEYLKVFAPKNPFNHFLPWEYLQHRVLRAFITSSASILTQLSWHPTWNFIWLENWGKHQHVLLSKMLWCINRRWLFPIPFLLTTKLSAASQAKSNNLRDPASPLSNLGRSRQRSSCQLAILYNTEYYMTIYTSVCLLALGILLRFSPDFYVFVMLV